MIALAIGMGWDPVDYHLAAHPVQRRMAAEVSRWCELAESEIPTAVDGLENGFGEPPGEFV